jgi:hypothetical protein
MAASTFRVYLWNNATNQLLTGYGGYVFIVPQGQPPNQNLPLSEDVINPGLYYRNGVNGGYYDIYIDLNKSGNITSSDLKLSGAWQPIPDDEVNADTIEDFSIENINLSQECVNTGNIAQKAVTLQKLADEVISAINAGKYPPDNVTIEVNLSTGKLQIKDGGITGAKVQNGAIDSLKLTIGQQGKLFIGDDFGGVIVDYIGTGNIHDQAITLAKLAQEVIDYIDAGGTGGGYPPDNITIGLDQFNRLEVKDGGINGATKIAQESITGDRITDETIESRSLQEGIIYAAHLEATALDPNKFERGATATTQDSWKIKTGSIELAELSQNVIDFINNSDLPGFANVANFGADPTGTNSSSQAFQDAINYLYNNFSGGTVIIPEGVYKIYMVQIKPNISFLGVGSVELQEGTVAPDPNTTTYPGTITNFGMLIFYASPVLFSRFLGFENLKFTSELGGNLSGINIVNNCDSVKINNCIFLTKGVDLNVFGAEIKNCYFSDTKLNFLGGSFAALLSTNNAANILNNVFDNTSLRLTRSTGLVSFISALNIQNNLIRIKAGVSGISASDLIEIKGVSGNINISGNYISNDSALNIGAIFIDARDNIAGNNNKPTVNISHNKITGFGSGSSKAISITYKETFQSVATVANNEITNCVGVVFNGSKFNFLGNIVTDKAGNITIYFFDVLVNGDRGGVNISGNDIYCSFNHLFSIGFNGVNNSNAGSQSAFLSGNNITINNANRVFLSLKSTAQSSGKFNFLIKNNRLNILASSQFLDGASNFSGSKVNFSENDISSVIDCNFQGAELIAKNNVIKGAGLWSNATAVITGNSIEGASTAIRLSTQSSGSIVVFNTIKNSTAAITDQGTNNTISNNVIV